MPSAAQHQVKYERNREFLNSGLAAGRPEWAAVVAFYAAVHLVERLAALESSGPIHNPNHVSRERWLGGHRRHRGVFPDYLVLKQAGEIARYGTVNQFERMFDSDDVQAVLIDTHLAAIEAHVAAATAT